MQYNAKQFEFYGKAGEFFKIWIVNIMLSIVTLGIYSAWAKVRTRQYFYNNTLLMNTPFDYRADPIKILKGRFFALAMILLFSFSSTVSPIMEGIFTLLFLVALPWIIIKALKFNLYNSAYRNIRFDFKSDYKEAITIFIGLPFLVMLSLGFAYPYFIKEQKKFVIDNTTYGTSQFKFSATTEQFYKLYLKCAGVSLLIVILSFGLFQLINSIQPLVNETIKPVLTFAIFILIYLLLMLIYSYLNTTLSNLIINHSSLKQFQFISTLETQKICWLYFSNALAIICSFGLLIPWAMIRTMRYRIACLSVIADTDLNSFFAAESETTNAIGEELGDMFDIDIGL